MDSKLSKKGWMSVVIWVGLVATTAFTSSSFAEYFNLNLQILYSTLTGGISDLFQNYGLLFATILAIGLIFLILSAWLDLVSYTFAVGQMVFGSEEEAEEEESDAARLPGSVARYLAFSWGLYLILYLIYPFVL
jgi:hypothetical protein